MSYQNKRNSLMPTNINNNSKKNNFNNNLPRRKRSNSTDAPDIDHYTTVSIKNNVSTLFHRL